MKAILKHSLYRRPQPTNEVMAVGFLPKDSVIDVETVVKGKMIDAIDDWYKAKDGFFYWGGGVEEIHIVLPFVSAVTTVPGSEREHFEFDDTKISWAHTALRIIDIWKESKSTGEDVRVAILDEGFDSTHIDLRPKLFERFTTEPDFLEHGTGMAGIIGAKGNMVTGVAPACEMLFAKINLNDANSVLQALSWARNNKADVISMSLRCKNDSGIENELLKCSQANIAVVTSIGNGGQSGNINDDVYPAKSPNCFGVGCFDRNFKRLAVSNISHNLKLMAPAQEILTAKAGNSTELLNGKTSLATAFTSGVVALLLSIARRSGKNSTGKEIVENLCQNADKRNNNGENVSIEYGFGLIDVFSSYLKIK